MTAAIRHVVTRHEILRCVFVPQPDGSAVQSLLPPFEVALPLIDLQQAADPAAELDRALDSVLAERFDLKQGPLVRCRLYRIAADEHVLCVVMHHAVTDGWSLGVLARELSSHYESFRRVGVASSEPPLPIQYVDFAQWQHDRVSEGGFAAESRYWEEQFRDVPDPLSLPMDGVRPEGIVRAAREMFTIPSDVAGRLRLLGQRHGATPYMVHLAAWSSFLGRLSGQRDVVVGSPFAGRSHAETEGLIGCFVNTLAMRCRWDRGETFGGLLATVRDRALDAYTHQDYPFALRIDSQ
jgi:hypothetical protein